MPFRESIRAIVPRLACLFLMCFAWLSFSQTTAQAEQAASGKPLRVAATRFGITPKRIIKTNTANLPHEAEIAGPLKTTVTLLDDGQLRVCCVCLDWVKIPRNATQLFRRALGAELGIPQDQVIFFTSHNHSDTSLVNSEMGGFEWGLPPYSGKPAELNEIGQELLTRLSDSVRTLSGKLEPVTVWWAVGHEDRITYNRKGRRADGSTFFMREEDRVLQGADFRGDIDSQAPVVVFKNKSGKIKAAWVQYTGHPVTSYSPEKPVVFGDYPTVACDKLARHLSQGQDEEVPVAFFQGCAGDVNSKEMFHGGVKRAIEFGEMLGESYIEALPKLKQSSSTTLNFTATTAELPLDGLPTEAELRKDLAEIQDFIKRAKAGDEDTLACAGLNFPRALSPQYRAGLVDRVRMWTEWALEQRLSQQESSLPPVMPVELWVLRVGDIGFVAMPCEPFLGIGRLMRQECQLPLTIPCGYTNYSIGYIPDGANIGGREYMSSFHRYSATANKNIRPRPPLKIPGGDVMALKGAEILNQMAKESP